MILEVNVKAVMSDNYIVATVKKVKVFGVVIYKKTIYNPPKDGGECYYHPSI
jgi:hypothetical protein